MPATRSARYAAAFGLIGLCAIAITQPQRAIAQDDPPRPPRPPQFSTLFPNPTGQNGFEEIVAAADMLRINPALDAALAPDATLIQKQAALNDLTCRRALAQMRAGLAKSLSFSGDLNDEKITNSLMHDMPFLERLADLLSVEQYVFSSDGRTEAAIHSLEDAFRLTDAVRDTTPASSLYAEIIDGEVIDALVRHQGQWSLANCNRILSLVQSRLVAPSDLGIRVLENTRKNHLYRINDLARLLDQPKVNPNEEDSIDALYSAWQGLGSDPKLRLTALEELRRRVNDTYTTAEAADPFRPTEPAAPPGSEKTGDPRVLAFVDSWVHVALPDPGKFRPGLARMQVRLRLLAVHAAIRRYRWEYGHLPASLSDLAMMPLTTDPYADAPYQYTLTPDGSGYTLASIGPQTGDTNRRGEIRLPQNDPPPWQ